jgi:MoaA/NifB/PqqE/SkfB family radical SAM enzyme
MDHFNSITIGITSRCNANCKFCSHNEPIRFDNGVLDVDLDIVLKPLLSRTKQIIMNGGLGDPILHPGFIKFIRMCRKEFPDLMIDIATNGSVQNEYFWKELGVLSNNKIKITFGIDGIRESHYKYRGTDFDQVISNLKDYISTGGNAIWQYILFDFNSDHIEDAATLAKKLGCIEFFTIRSDVYDEEFKSPNGLLSRNEVMESLQGMRVNCYWKQRNTFYINEYGEVHPCCHMLPYFNLEMYDDIRSIYLEHRDSISLYNHDIDTVMRSPYLKYIDKNNKNIKRCCITCRSNRSLMPLIKRVKHYKFMDKVENDVT